VPAVNCAGDELCAVNCAVMNCARRVVRGKLPTNQLRTTSLFFPENFRMSWIVA
jgi:hypothetical protein